MSTFALRKATRQKTKLRIGLSGPSGSGKTYSALQLASGLAAWDKIALIDTENGSGDLYSHLGGYHVLPLTAPFTPERYIEAIEACQKAGMEVIILDSATHEWDGIGGCLESNDLIAKTRFKGNTWSAWSVTTPRHQKFIQAIVASPCHVVSTVRSKTDTIQTEDKKVKKVGMKEIQRDGWEYEQTLNFNLDRDGNIAIASNDRTELFSNADPFKITPETGKKLLDWANSGVEPLPPVKVQPTATQAMEHLTACATLPPLQTVYDRLMTYEWKGDDLEAVNVCYANVYGKLIGAPTRDGSMLLTKDMKVAALIHKQEKGNILIETDAEAVADTQAKIDKAKTPPAAPTEADVAAAEEKAKAA